MSKVDVIRAWKDAEYRESLSVAERAALPDNPAGLSGLTAGELEGVEGGIVLYQDFLFLNPYLRAQPQTPGTLPLFW